MFPNEKCELSVGWRAAQKAEDWAGGLHKKAVRWAAEKGSPPACSFPQASLLCSPLACRVVQPAGPPFCAAHQSAENSWLSFGNTALQPALNLVLSNGEVEITSLPVYNEPHHTDRMFFV